VSPPLETIPLRTALEVALELNAQGIPIFPVRNTDKRPLKGSRGWKDGSRDCQRVVEMFKDRPLALIAMPTGWFSGISVLDIDPKNGGNTWLEAHRNILPLTRTHHTRSGGRHFLFKHREGVRDSESKIAPGVDTRGTGGYIVLWSAHGYPVEHPDIVADWPDWLYVALYPPEPPRPAYRAPEALSNGSTAAQAYANAALRHACERIALAPPGSRPDYQLFKEGAGLAKLVSSGAIGLRTVADALASAAWSAGLSQRDIATCLERALKIGGAL